MSNSAHRGARSTKRLGTLAMLAATVGASAQLQPERTYYGIHRQIPMSVTVPEGADGNARIVLHRPKTGESAGEASVAPGRVDLASLFPNLWLNDRPTVLYAQLYVGDEGVGSPVVLQPMLTPPIYTNAPQQPGMPPQPPVAQRLPVTYSGIRAYVEVTPVMVTSQGEIPFRMRPDEAPNTVWNFLQLAEGGFYTDVIFHRIIGPKADRPGFVIQGGDPTGSGSGGPGYFIDLEGSTLPHDFGVLSMARTGIDPNTSSSQVFICLSREGTASLDRSYISFAEAVGGADVIRSLGSVPIGPGDRPIEPPKIIEVRLDPAPPFGTGPAPLSQGAGSSAGQPR